MGASSRTGLIWHERFMWHDTSALAGVLPAGRDFVEPDEPTEHPATKRRIKHLLDAAGLTSQLVAITPRPAGDDELGLVHDRDYIAAIRTMSAGAGGDASLGRPEGITPFGPGGFEIAALAAGGVIAAVDAVLDGTVHSAYSLVRPPGHHAEPDHGFGFCIFHNAAIGTRHAMRRRGLGRVALVDWDVHHGNGAQRIFWTERNVLTISIHQDGAYPPGSGSMRDNGADSGIGYNLNIPMPAGSGAGAYLAAFERVIVPALHRFRPDLIIVSCGFDAGAFDPLGRMMLHSDAFRTMTQMIQAAATDLCGGRLVLCHEGGYHRTSVPFFALAVVEQLCGRRTGVADPFLRIVAPWSGQALQPHQDAVVREAEKLVQRIS
jgi:acetoin utilization deacetylase AcuC-like enzyme